MEILIEYTYTNTDNELKGCKQIHSFDVFKFDTSITQYNHDRLQMLISVLIRDYIPQNATINRVQVNDIGK